MKKFYFSLFILPLLALASCQQKTHLEFVETTDIHGYMPYLIEEAAYFDQQRAQYGDNFILLDGGDNLQGTTCVYYAKKNPSIQHIASRAFNYLGYDVVTIGNHDIEAGKDVCDRFFSELNAEVVCANLIDESTSEPYYKPYTILERDGVRIAVLGMITPYVSFWVHESLRKGLTFEKLETSAQKWIDIIREKENPDIMIGLFHSGLIPTDETLNSDELGLENSTLWVAQNIPGFDIIFYGHDHKANATKVANIAGDSVWVVNGGYRACNVAQVSVDFKKSFGKVTKNIDAKVVVMDSEKDPSIPTTDTVFNKMVFGWKKRCDSLQGEKITVLTHEISSYREDFINPNEWISFIHEAQFTLAKLNGYDAQISFTAPLTVDAKIAAGDMYVRDFFSLYRFENYLSVVRMLGSEVKKYLEYSYKIYFLKNGTFYNFDTAEGIDYTVQLDGTDAHINIERMSDGTPFDPSKVYNVVMNSYRAAGGGGHLIVGLGWNSQQIMDNTIWTSDSEIRSLIIDLARNTEEINPKAVNNWRWVK